MYLAPMIAMEFPGPFRPSHSFIGRPRIEHARRRTVVGHISMAFVEFFWTKQCLGVFFLLEASLVHTDKIHLPTAFLALRSVVTVWCLMQTDAD